MRDQCAVAGRKAPFQRRGAARDKVGAIGVGQLRLGDLAVTVGEDRAVALAFERFARDVVETGFVLQAINQAPLPDALRPPRHQPSYLECNLRGYNSITLGRASWRELGREVV